MEVFQNFLHTISRMQWSDYLDIIMVALLIYELLPLIKTPKTMKITRTVVAVVLLAWITDAMKLHTLSWILNQFLAIGLLAFVVLFQPELRSMLDHLTDMRFTNIFDTHKPVQEMEYVITETVKACAIMSKLHTGALIVFARERNLDQYIKQGVQIDGLVTQRLLLSIFYPNAALHDKAVIVQNGRIAAARCELPRASGTLPPVLLELGTRHNSAFGMSQETDAVVVVVSEETGAISVAVGGMLKRKLTPDMLEKHLRQELCPKQEEHKNPKETAADVLKKITGWNKEDGYEEE